MKAMHLGRMTAKSVFTVAETTCYPAAQRCTAPFRRGGVACAIEDCIFCSKCSRACPAGALSVDREKSTWGIDRLACVQCGYCVSNCPKDCLSMVSERPCIATQRSKEVHAPKPAEE